MRKRCLKIYLIVGITLFVALATNKLAYSEDCFSDADCTTSPGGTCVKDDPDDCCGECEYTPPVECPAGNLACTSDPDNCTALGYDDGYKCTLDSTDTILCCFPINCPGDVNQCDPQHPCPGSVCKPETCNDVSGDRKCCVSSNASASTECLAAAGDCDEAEFCDGAGNCPADTKLTTECRPAVDVCDEAEDCDGVADDCPDDVFKPTTTVCRVADGDCDVEEKCDGASNACPDDVFEPTTTVCRAADGDCDVEEKCDGASNACPDDVFEPTTTVCRVADGDCDIEEKCDGASNACPDDVFEPITTVCRVDAGDCDIEEKCDGASNACPDDVFEAEGSGCNDDDLCTGPDTCTDGTCSGPPANNGAGCSDGNYCTDPDSCTAGTCSGPPANNGMACEDGDACTTTGTCTAGACVGGTAVTCDDSNVCTDDSCNPASGCVYANNTASCNGSDECLDGVCQEATLVELSLFEAVFRKGRVMVHWVTKSEKDTAGFDIERSLEPNEGYEKINSTMIPAEGDELTGAEYSLVDKHIKRTKYYYQLKEYELGGKVNYYGPVDIDLTPKGKNNPNRGKKN